MKTVICLATALLLCACACLFFLPRRTQGNADVATELNAVARPIAATEPGGQPATPIQVITIDGSGRSKSAPESQVAAGVKVLAQQLRAKIDRFQARGSINLRPDLVIDMVNQNLGLSIPKTESVIARLEAAQREFERTNVQAQTETINELKAPIVEELRAQGRFEEQDASAVIRRPRRPKGSGSVAIAFEGGNNGTPRRLFEITETEFPEYFKTLEGLEEELAEAWLPIALEAMIGS